MHRSVAGVCASAFDPGDCDAGDMGSWLLRASEARTNAAVATACERLCSGCERCRFFSYSRAHLDCTWSHACKLDRLRPRADFRSARWSARNRTAAAAPLDRNRCLLRQPLKSGVPRILHQSWNNRTLPRVLAAMSARWDALLPSWEHRLAEENRGLWEAHFPELLPIYDGYERYVERADVTRLLYMWVHGGVYADLDTAPCRALESAAALDAQHLVLVRGPSRTNGSAAGLSNFLVAAAPRHPFFKLAIRMVARRHRDPRGTLHATGGSLLDDALQAFRRNVQTKCPAHLARSAAVTVLTYRELEARLATHHYLSTWQGGGAIVEDQGLLAWLGVDVGAQCEEGRLSAALAGLDPPLRKRVKGTYPALRGRDGRARGKRLHSWYLY